MSQDKVTKNETHPVNSVEYWDARFRSGDWQEQAGDLQTHFFGTLLLSMMPQWLCTDIAERSMSICDWGCAEGQMAHLLKEMFPRSSVTGIDVSTEALLKAREKFPDCVFKCEDWHASSDSSPQYDVVIASNILEHFDAPLEVLRRVLFKRARNYVAVLVPFNEPEGGMCREHVSRFTHESIPVNFMGEGWHCVFYSVDNAAKRPVTQWSGGQALAVYASSDHLLQMNHWLPSMADLDGDRGCLLDDLREMRETNVELVQDLQEAQSLRQSLQEEKSALTEDLMRARADLEAIRAMLNSNHVRLSLAVGDRLYGLYRRLFRPGSARDRFLRLILGIDPGDPPSRRGTGE